MKILKLTIEKKYFDMIYSGEKPEEYREYKTYWISRLVPKIKINSCDQFKKFDAIHFFNGAYFSKKLPNFIIELKYIKYSTGQKKWGAEPNKYYFVLKLGKILKKT